MRRFIDPYREEYTEDIPPMLMQDILDRPFAIISGKKVLWPPPQRRKVTR